MTAPRMCDGCKSRPAACTLPMAPDENDRNPILYYCRECLASTAASLQAIADQAGTAHATGKTCLAVPLTSAEMGWLEATAQKLGISIDTLIENAIRDFLIRHEVASRDAQWPPAGNPSVFN